MELKDQEILLDKVKSQVTELVDGKIKEGSDKMKELEKTIKEMMEKNISESLKKNVAELQEEFKAYKEGAKKKSTEQFSLRKQLEANIETLEKIKDGSTKTELTLKVPAKLALNTNITGSNTILATEIEYAGVKESNARSAILMDIVNSGKTNYPTITWIDEINPDGDAEFVPECGLKPLCDADFEPRVSLAKKIAVSKKVSMEMLMDLDWMEQWIRDRLFRSVNLRCEQALFNGDSSVDANSIDGITTFASPFVPGSLAASVLNPTVSDVIRAMVAQIEVQTSTDVDFDPNYVLLNPSDLAQMDLDKGTDGHYILPPFVSASGREVYGLKVKSTTLIPQGFILVGDFMKSNFRTYLDFLIKIGYENDDFTKNQVTMLGEKRIHHYISSNEAVGFVYDQISVAKTAIEKV